MGIVGHIVLLFLSLLLIVSLFIKNRWGAKNYILKNVVGIYILCLGLLSVMKAFTNGMEEGLYLGFVGLVIAFLALFVFRKNYRLSFRLNIIGIVISTIAVYFSYMN